VAFIHIILVDTSPSHAPFIPSPTTFVTTGACQIFPNINISGLFILLYWKLLTLWQIPGYAQTTFSYNSICDVFPNRVSHFRRNISVLLTPRILISFKLLKLILLHGSPWVTSFVPIFPCFYCSISLWLVIKSLSKNLFQIKYPLNFISEGRVRDRIVSSVIEPHTHGCLFKDMGRIAFSQQTTSTQLSTWNTESWWPFSHFLTFT
jgi:hypothetical protein